ncbi:MAG: hypothetical protein WBM32_12270 [Crocosphaera sp.]|jgi:hypothetical protein
MKRQTNLQILGVGFSFSLLLMGCNPEAIDLTEDSYQPINLAEVKGELTGDEPEAMTLALFGNKEQVEGNFSQEINVLEQAGFEKTIILTQMNLPDDSVRGIRYQLQFEFDQSIGKWSLKTAGRQQSCYRSDSPTDWTIEPCP